LNDLPEQQQALSAARDLRELPLHCGRLGDVLTGSAVYAARSRMSG
jgi:hypothetical protein